MAFGGVRDQGLRGVEVHLGCEVVVGLRRVEAVLQRVRGADDDVFWGGWPPPAFVEGRGFAGG